MLNVSRTQPLPFSPLTHATLNARHSEALAYAGHALAALARTGQPLTSHDVQAGQNVTMWLDAALARMGKDSRSLAEPLF